MLTTVDRWFALEVRCRHEKRVGTMLRGKGLESFVPIHNRLRRRSNGDRMVETPLIPGYVFCRFDVNRRMPILTTPGVLSIVSFGRGPEPMEAEEIRNLRSLMDSELSCEPWPYLKEGQLVRLTAGPLCGVRGRLLGTERDHRMILSVTLLQRSVAVTVERGWVEPIRAARPAPRKSISSLPTPTANVF